MPTTSNRAYVTPAHGGAVGTYDTPLNNVFQQIDQNLGAVSNVALSNVNVVLAANQYVCGTIRFSGTLTGNVVVTFPAVSGWWVVENACTGNFYIQLTCGAANRVCAPPGESVDILTDGTGVRYRNLGRVGSFLDIAVTGMPAWISNCTVPPYLFCDGTTFSAVTYPALNQFLGGNTLPDARGRLRATTNNGTNRITTGGSGVNGDALFAAGGTQDVTLTTGQMPSHSHGVNDPGHDHDIPFGPAGVVANIGTIFSSIVQYISAVVTGSTASATTGISIQSSGSDQAHNNMPPTYIGGITLIRAA